jgi:hypothetical protein
MFRVPELRSRISFIYVLRTRSTMFVISFWINFSIGSLRGSGYQ